MCSVYHDFQFLAQNQSLQEQNEKYIEYATNEKLITSSGSICRYTAKPLFPNLLFYQDNFYLILLFTVFIYHLSNSNCRMFLNLLLLDQREQVDTDKSSSAQSFSASEDTYPHLGNPGVELVGSIFQSVSTVPTEIPNQSFHTQGKGAHSTVQACLLSHRSFLFFLFCPSAVLPKTFITKPACTLLCGVISFLAAVLCKRIIMHQFLLF